MRGSTRAIGAGRCGRGRICPSTGTSGSPAVLAAQAIAETLVHDKKTHVPCACGCGQRIKKFDKYGNRRRFMYRHGNTAQQGPGNHNASTRPNVTAAPQITRRRPVTTTRPTSPTVVPAAEHSSATRVLVIGSWSQLGNPDVNAAWYRQDEKGPRGNVKRDP